MPSSEAVPVAWFTGPLTEPVARSAGLAMAQKALQQELFALGKARVSWRVRSVWLWTRGLQCRRICERVGFPGGMTGRRRSVAGEARRRSVAAVAA